MISFTGYEWVEPKGQKVSSSITCVVFGRSYSLHQAVFLDLCMRFFPPPPSLQKNLQVKVLLLPLAYKGPTQEAKLEY